MPDDCSDPIVLCGFGHLGRRVFALLARLGESVHVISREPPGDWPEPAPPGCRLIVGDARNESRLREAGVGAAGRLIAATHDDPTNISIALSAKRLNPSIAVVVRLFDQDLGTQLEEALGLERTFSTSALAAPAFVAAALGRTGGIGVDCPGTALHLEEIRMDGDRGLAGLSAAEWMQKTGKVLVALRRGGQKVFAPGPHWMLASGDQLLVVDDRSGGPHLAPPIRSDRPGIRMRLEGLREWWREAPGALRTTLATLLIIATGSIGIFHFGLDMSFVDALYFVITIITTTGFGDFNLMNAAPALKLYGVFLMLCGAAILATIFSIITDMALRTRLRDVFARGCSRYSGHIIVAGLGNVGFRIVNALSELGEQVVAVEQDESGKFVRTARALVPVVMGNARMEETLRKAGAGGAQAVIAATDNDISNLSIGLAAKRLRPDCRTVLRVFDADLAEKMNATPVADCVLSVSRIAAASFAASALDRNVRLAFELDDHLVAFVDPAPGSLPGAAAAVPGDSRDCSRGAMTLSAGGGAAPGREIGLRWYKYRDGTSGECSIGQREAPADGPPPC